MKDSLIITLSVLCVILLFTTLHYKSEYLHCKNVASNVFINDTVIKNDSISRNLKNSILKNNREISNIESSIKQKYVKIDKIKKGISIKDTNNYTKEVCCEDFKMCNEICDIQKTIISQKDSIISIKDSIINKYDYVDSLNIENKNILSKKVISLNIENQNLKQENSQLKEDVVKYKKQRNYSLLGNIGQLVLNIFKVW